MLRATTIRDPMLAATSRSPNQRKYALDSPETHRDSRIEFSFDSDRILKHQVELRYRNRPPEPTMPTAPASPLRADARTTPPVHALP
jgi:hypothetical protein